MFHSYSLFFILQGPDILTLASISSSYLSFLFSSIMHFLRSLSIIVMFPCLVTLMWRIWWGSQIYYVFIALISIKGLQTGSRRTVVCHMPRLLIKEALSLFGKLITFCRGEFLKLSVDDISFYFYGIHIPWKHIEIPFYNVRVPVL